MEKYNSYSVEDYLDDPRFRSWVLAPSQEKSTHWEEVFTRFPEQEKIAKRASFLLKEMEGFFQPESLKSKHPDPAFIAEMKGRMKTAKQKKVRQKPKRILLPLSIAASVLLFISISLDWFQPKQSLKWQELSTTYGEWESHFLPDSSEIILNANSKIRFAENWKAGQDREVWIKGEAFFKVRKDTEGAKFKVHTDDLVVEVLGTSFNVRTRGEETEVYLQEGKVQLDLKEEEKLMAPGDFISYSAQKDTLLKDEKQTKVNTFSWTDGALIMQRMKAEEIFEKIEEIYGYQIIGADSTSLNSVRTLALPIDKIEVAIPILEKSFGVTILKEDGKLLFSK